MKQTRAHLAIALLSLVVGVARAGADEAGAVFERIKGLAGRWEGITYWSTNPDKREDVNMIYYLTGRGSAVVENFSTGSQPSMTSVFHRDGEDLRMTHFCSAMNQPRLKATRIDEEKGIVNFSLVDITNLAAPTAGHVSGFEMNLSEDQQLALKFTFSQDGEEIYEFIELTRTKSADSGSSRSD